MEGLIWLHNNLHGSTFVNTLAKFITFLGEWAFLWIGIALFLLFFKKTRVSAVVMLISLAIGYIFNDFILKNIFNRPRPFEEYSAFASFIKGIGMDLPSGNSFPSGHSFSSLNCAVVLTLFHKKAGYVVLPVAVMIALSRIFLCVHYPTDVLVGMILGIITAVLSFTTYRAILRKIKQKERNKIRTNDNV